MPLHIKQKLVLKCTDVMQALEEIGDINGKPSTYYETAKEAYEHRSHVENLKQSLANKAKNDPYAYKLTIKRNCYTTSYLGAVNRVS